MTPLGNALVFLALLVVITLAILAFYQHGYKKGHDAGYDRGYLAGRRDADNWWIGVEKEAREAQEKIWREEAS